LTIAPLHNETLLLRQLSEGSAAAFREVYSAYVDAIYEVGLVYLKQPELAEDVVQSTFLKVWELRAQLPELESFTGWLYILARNLMIAMLRKEALQEKYVHFLKERMEMHVDFPEQQLVQKEAQRLIRSAIDQLTPQQRTAFLLQREEGLTYAAIGIRMGVATNTVRKHIHLALEALRAAIQSHGKEGILALIYLSYII